METTIKHPVPDWVKPSSVIFDIWALWHSPECQSAQMSKCYRLYRWVKHSYCLHLFWDHLEMLSLAPYSFLWIYCTDVVIRIVALSNDASHHHHHHHASNTDAGIAASGNYCSSYQTKQ